MSDSEKIIQRLPIASPPRPTTPPGPALTDEQQEKLTKAIENFSSPDFKIGGIDENPGLTEDERFWLVSILHHFSQVL
jgi:hypothetical protein